MANTNVIQCNMPVEFKQLLGSAVLFDSDGNGWVNVVLSTYGACGEMTQGVECQSINDPETLLKSCITTDGCGNPAIRMTYYSPT